MVSRRSISTARWAAAILSGIGSLSIFFILWRPFFSIEHDDATMAYGIISITWTIAAALVLLGGFYVLSLLQWHVSALAALPILFGVVWFILWRLSPMARQASPSLELVAAIGGSLLPPLIFGWLLGNYRRSRRFTNEQPHQS